MWNETEDGGSNRNTIEASRTWEKRDKENRDAYVTSSYCIGKVHEEKKVGAVHDRLTHILPGQSIGASMWQSLRRLGQWMIYQ